MKKNILIVLVLVIFIAFAWWHFTATEDERTGSQKNNQPTLSDYSTAPADNVTAPAKKVRWNFDGEEYAPSGTPRACPDPLEIESPVDVSKASSILYPGQYRGDDFKAHGGFRFDGYRSDAITVTVPLDARLQDASRYIEDGQVQYLFDFIHDCGIMYRFDHLATLTPRFEAYARQLPEAKVNDSRTTLFPDDVYVTTGDVIATSVNREGNVFVDFGVYDLRQKNGITIDEKNSLARHGICWFDLLPASDAQRVKSLPASDERSGAKSEYCR
ncbi:MAG: hypothetical protein UX02_C0002G0330 [Candidatus Moranbacteria bacterium GW2011_GWC1_45_18]|nr:MAG: hypothetical protein UT79_C0001G0131 [Candidatus Moranbacteria bacterium GW2011_GWC2_40_12]KKT33733.1 MAG: hypothetical protein UW19_C0006G0035 [Candidatus Moranbacteria bacterium GW2011_GWF2_44_10]KKT69770.1 MAG: hypothetical protein UW66_C0062G0006 [Candidatus Moranbacteria bacterium GW2011_GWF1_44_4]KKU00087.1 MAG: hypothetical protein UX02_C0002G0330 [Candidatus Moranbacteria bacterium GW2011_GWC1_45_18]OGI22277.1 MAG: hypothetical protein A2194_00385 [Candidatus Moranbacteria bacte